MGMDDIQPLLESWPYEPDKLCVRRIKGTDGEEKIQLRVEMGILQMEVSGRPDGQRPHGYESLLHYYKAKVRASPEDSKTYRLDPDVCLSLQVEGLQYYHRRISFLELGEYRLAQDDAQRNLDMFDFVKEHAREEEDSMVLEQYRPFVIGHRIRAVVLQELEDENFDRALLEIHNGIEEIQRLLQRVRQARPRGRQRRGGIFEGMGGRNPKGSTQAPVSGPQGATQRGGCH